MNPIFYNLDKNIHSQNEASTTKKKSFTFKMKTKLPTVPETAIMQSDIALHSQDNFIYSSESEYESDEDDYDECSFFDEIKYIPTKENIMENSTRTFYSGEGL